MGYVVGFRMCFVVRGLLLSLVILCLLVYCSVVVFVVLWCCLRGHWAVWCEFRDGLCLCDLDLVAGSCISCCGLVSTVGCCFVCLIVLMLVFLLLSVFRLFDTLAVLLF